MKIKASHVVVLHGSASIEVINSQTDIESLYSIDDEMQLRGWSIDVWDYDYMNYLCVSFDRDANCQIINSPNERNRFVNDLVECINEVLNNNRNDISN